MKAKAFEDLLCVAGEELQLRGAVFGSYEAYELDLVELMLPNQAARVLAVASRFASKASRVRRVRDRERSAVEDLVGVQVRDLYLRGGREIEVVALRVLVFVPVGGDAKHVLR